MPNNPKCFIHGTVLDVTFRAEQDLPLVASEYMQLILKGIFARAQSLYPVTICHFLVMANHIHMILVVRDPAAVKDFVGTIKKESAHAVNRLLGRRKRTIWCDGYDSPQILDPDKVMERIVHIYTNPQRANLEDRIERYPNFNSWQAFLRGGIEQKVRRIPRCVISKLPKTTLTLAEQRRVAVKLLEESIHGGTLFIDPDAWLNCFAETKGANAERYKRETIARVRAEENRLDKMRKHPVLGAAELRLQPMDRPHLPKKFGIRMICLSSFKELRVTFIDWYKKRCGEATEAIAGWKVGDWLAKFPPGFFLPGGFLQSNVNPAAIF